MTRPVLATNRKFLRLARALDGNAALARGALELLWEPCYAAGEPYVGTSDDIEAVCGWRGVRGVLTAALLDAGKPDGAGFIEPYTGIAVRTPGPHYQIHDLLNDGPRHLRHLARKAPRVCGICASEYVPGHPRQQFCSNKCRSKGFRDHRRNAPVRYVTQNKVSDPTPTNETGPVAPDRNALCVTDCVTRNAPVRYENPNDRVPYVRYVHAVPKNTAVREQQAEREEQVRNGSTCTSSALEIAFVEGLEPPEPEIRRSARTTPLGTRHPSPSPDDSPVLLTFPTVGQGGPSWLLREARIAQWRTLYPNLDVLAEARQALAWVEADDTRRKTAKGMLRYLVSWFNRAVDRPGRGGATLITGSLKTAGNKAAMLEWLKERGHGVE